MDFLGLHEWFKGTDSDLLIRMSVSADELWTSDLH